MIHCYPSLSSVDDRMDFQATALLSALLQGPLVQDNVLLTLDRGADRVLDLNQILSYRGNQSAPVASVSTDSPQHFFDRAPVFFLRGNLVTAVIIFTSSPKTFLDSLDHRWNPAQLLLINLNISLDTEELLEHDTIQRSEKVALIEKGSKNGDLKFFVYTGKPYKPANKWKSIKDLIGVWETHEIFQTKKDLLPERFNTFDGAVLYLGSWCDDFPFLYPVGEECMGTSLELLDIIATKLNFTYDVQMETDDHNWGSKENGTWTGMLGDLVHNNKDLVVNYFLLTEERQEDFDTTYAYYSEGFSFAVKIPPPLPQWPGLLYPFTGEMWVTTIGTVAVVALLLTVCLYAMPEEQNPTQAFLLILGGVLNQSVHHRLENSWSRLWAGWWWLAAVIITTGYTSNLIAFLTVPVYPTRVETVDELAASGLRVCMQDYGNFLPGALKLSSDASLYKLGHNLDLFPYAYLSYGIGLGWVLNGTHALVETYSYLVHVIEIFNQTDSTYLMKENVYPGYLTWFLKKNCPYTNVITGALTRLVEAGLVDQLYMKHMVQSLGNERFTRRNKVSRGLPLQVEQLLGAFMLWAIGMGIAIAVFGCEQITRNVKAI